jgi:nucleoid-associated protein YgaU
MIVVGSRYMGQPVVTVPIDAQGDTAAVVFGGPPAPGPTTFVYYTVKAGDRLDSIAFKLYGVADYWWKIANANPEIFYPDSLLVGSIIRLPAQ